MINLHTICGPDIILPYLWGGCLQADINH